MQRVLIRLTALCGVVVFGLIAIVYAQRGVRPTELVDDEPQVALDEQSLEPIVPEADAAPGGTAAVDPFAADRLRDRFTTTPSATPRAEQYAGQSPSDDEFNAQAAAAVPADPYAASAAGAGTYADDDAADAGNDAYSGATYSSDAQGAHTERYQDTDAYAGDVEPAGSDYRETGDAGYGDPRYAEAARGGERNAYGADPQPNELPLSAGVADDGFQPGSTRTPPGPTPLPARDLGTDADGDDSQSGAMGQHAGEASPVSFERYSNGGGGEAGNLSSRAVTDTNAGDEGLGTPGNRQLEGIQAPALLIRKIAPEEVQVGKPAKFQISVRNNGDTAAHGVEIRDLVPRGTRLLSTSPTADQGTNGELVWALGTLRPGAETSVELQLLPVSEGEIGSVATVQFQAEASARTVATRPQLLIEIDGPGDVMLGDELTLTIKLSNIGSGTATAVVLEEEIPPGLEHAAGSRLEYEVGDLPPKETRELELTLRAARPGRVVNRIVARGDGEAAAANDIELEVVAPALEISMTGPKRRFLERSATYEISVANPGTAAARDVELSLELPAGLEFIETNNYGQFDPSDRRVYWSLEELPPGETGTVSLTAKPTEPGEHQLTLQATSASGLAVEQQETVLVEGVAAILFEVVDAEDPIEIGTDTTYEIHVVNQGTKAASNVRILADLPEGMQPIAADGPTRHVAEGQRVVFDALTRLAPKADTTYQIRVKGTRAGDMRVRVQVVTDDIRTPITKEESTRVYADQ